MKCPWGEKEDQVLARVAFTLKIKKNVCGVIVCTRPGASISHYCAPSHQNGTLYKTWVATNSCFSCNMSWVSQYFIVSRLRQRFPRNSCFLLFPIRSRSKLFRCEENFQCRYPQMFAFSVCLSVLADLKTICWCMWQRKAANPHN